MTTHIEKLSETTRVVVGEKMALLQHYMHGHWHTLSWQSIPLQPLPKGVKQVGKA